MNRTPPSRPSSSSLDSPLDSSSPLLGSGYGSREIAAGQADDRNVSRRGSLSTAARFMRRAGGRRMMREPSMQVRETAAEQLEERHSDWANSKPVVLLDLTWNLAFVIAAVVVLVSSRDEPAISLRVWVSGYALQCVWHMICVFFEYRRRRQQSRRSTLAASRSSIADAITRSQGLETYGHESLEVGEIPLDNASLAKRLESANTLFSFVWWIIGFYWITAGGQTLAQKAPQLYWICIVFLAFDIFFVVFCVGLACIIGVAVCCCLPCIIAILYAVTDQEGASEEDISSLPKFRFHRTGSFDKTNGEKLNPSRGVMSLIGSLDAPRDRKLSAEDAECCICISSYEDGVELRELPCSHHFHCTCIDKWLRINATCPLCKYNIIKSNVTAIEDV